jgi:uncharacterized phage-associated protein
MASAYEVARYLVRLAAHDEEPDYLTNRRLQKLLYYAQAWSLAMRDKPLFDDRIEAWASGPVVPSVCDRFEGLWRRVLLPDDVEEERVIEMEPDEVDFVASVWESYKAFSPSRLREMTREEDPWRKARGNLSPIVRCNEEITLESMRDYFTHAVS